MAGSLPDLKRLDADALQALLLAAHSELEIAREKLLSRDQEVEYLKLQLQKLRRMLFGRSSEKVAQQIEQSGVAAGRSGDREGRTCAEKRSN